MAKRKLLFASIELHKESISDRVFQDDGYKLELKGGKIIKRISDQSDPKLFFPLLSLLKNEFDVLGYLFSEGAPVPKPLSLDSCTGVLIEKFIPYKTLHQIRFRLSMEAQVALVLEIARTLHLQLHKKGVTHHDLHPGNLVLGPKLTFIDFSASSRLGVAQTSKLVYGSVPRTCWDYAAPEEYTFDKAPDSGSSGDIFSLGALFYDLLSKRAPFCEIRPSSNFALNHFDTPFWPVLDRAMKKAWQDRYRTTLEMADEIDKIAAKEGLKIPPYLQEVD
jgi:serine/threonine protein kinase